MYKKHIEYVDYDGNERKEDFYFNLTQAELVEMQMSEKGGLEKLIQNIIDTQDTPRIIQLFKDLILKSYGVKSLDGKRFMKNDELREEFSQTEAFSKLFMELATDANAAAEFVNKIVPQEAKAQTNATPIPVNK